MGEQVPSRPRKTCKVTVDGTNCQIQEPWPFKEVNEKWWYSHEFKGPGLRYEVAICIQTGDMVWINGPFMCGNPPDLKIFPWNLKHRLAPGEMVEADRAAPR
jgi:hypothetical protein